jgi:hypothetical protein
VDRVIFAATRADAAAAGFDDDLIYRELLLPPPDRSHLPMSQLLRNEALGAFQDWHLLDQKVEY